MFENIGHFFKRMVIKPEQKELGSKDAAKERLHLVLMQDRANVSADFLELMKQEIIDVIKKYIVVDESSIDVRLTNQSNDDGTNGAPALYANIPIVNIKNDMMAEKVKEFEGVDFNKEMGIFILDDKKQEDIQSSESKEETENSNQDIKPIIEKIEENETAEESNKETDLENEISEVEELNNEEVSISKEESNEENEESFFDVNEKENKNDSEIDLENDTDIENEEVTENDGEKVNNDDEEPQTSNVDYVDEEDDDDDVTFDDLLKAAEEDERRHNKKKNRKKRRK